MARFRNGESERERERVRAETLFAINHFALLTIVSKSYNSNPITNCKAIYIVETLSVYCSSRLKTLLSLTLNQIIFCLTRLIIFISDSSCIGMGTSVVRR